MKRKWWVLAQSSFSPQGNERQLARVKTTGIHGKVEVKRKWWVLAQSSFSPQGNERQLARVKTTGIDNPTQRMTQEASIVKGWEDKRDRGRIPDTFP